MTKTITKIGNSQGLVFDSALMDMAHLKIGDQVSITVHQSGSIILTPLKPVIDSEKAADTAKRLIRKNSELFRRLS
jgi:antitoxin component of MazEF toxin-antitoxin module